MVSFFRLGLFFFDLENLLRGRFIILIGIIGFVDCLGFLGCGFNCSVGGEVVLVFVFREV